MARFPQRSRTKGSQHWIQQFVNGSAALLDERIGLGPVAWRSPLASDEFAEYRDDAVLDVLDARPSKRPLRTFWPRGGPQWDALGRALSGEIVLVEAKAHLNELYSPPMDASAEPSIARIQLSLREVQQGLGVSEAYDWSKQFYQYANRLAWAYWLDRLNMIPTRLVFVYVVGDVQVGGPADSSEWELAIDAVRDALGLRQAPPFVTDLFVDVRESAKV